MLTSVFLRISSVAGRTPAQTSKKLFMGAACPTSRFTYQTYLIMFAALSTLLLSDDNRRHNGLNGEPIKGMIPSRPGPTLFI